ncbi:MULTISPECIES: DUF6691 family protein [Neptunomonas]|uniref:Uncharacterized protein n=1 Tax=Neptunomonas marina TaxID=1815562 RepID=A0A437QAA0_9GAMM|nr:MULTISPECIES: DUF6691 family protein [Neptunomonas]RVU31445.1 hypothetical protein EOE65_05525 [Neptunomonas marina]
MKIILALILGTLFGFVLQRVGATDSRKIWGMLTLRDLHLAKAILFAIGVSSIVLFAGMSIGIIDAGHLSVKSSYNGVIVGGMLLGLGWAIAGYCPGTGVAAMGEGKPDAFVYVLGGLAGAFLYTLSYGAIADSWLFSPIGGGKVTLAATGEYSALIATPSAMLVALVLGGLFAAFAVLAPKKI